LAGKNPADYFKYQKLDVVCKYFYEDGTRLNAYADTKNLPKKLKHKPANLPHHVKTPG
jgi:hypothetical protein